MGDQFNGLERHSDTVDVSGSTPLSPTKFYGDLFVILKNVAVEKTATSPDFQSGVLIKDIAGSNPVCHTNLKICSLKIEYNCKG